jgi:hypothetical protein
VTWRERLLRETTPLRCAIYWFVLLTLSQRFSPLVAIWVHTKSRRTCLHDGVRWQVDIFNSQASIMIEPKQNRMRHSRTLLWPVCKKVLEMTIGKSSSSVSMSTLSSMAKRQVYIPPYGWGFLLQRETHLRPGVARALDRSYRCGDCTSRDSGAFFARAKLGPLFQKDRQTAIDKRSDGYTATDSSVVAQSCCRPAPGAAASSARRRRAARGRVSPTWPNPASTQSPNTQRVMRASR